MREGRDAGGHDLEEGVQMFCLVVILDGTGVHILERFISLLHSMDVDFAGEIQSTIAAPLTGGRNTLTLRTVRDEPPQVRQRLVAQNDPQVPRLVPLAHDRVPVDGRQVGWPSLLGHLLRRPR